MKKTLTTSLLLAASILPFYSCQEYSPFSLEEMTKAEFSKNFFDEYGQFPADMNWDLSSQARTAKIDPSVFDIGSQKNRIVAALCSRRYITADSRYTVVQWSARKTSYAWCSNWDATLLIE